MSRIWPNAEFLTTEGLVAIWNRFMPMKRASIKARCCRMRKRLNQFELMEARVLLAADLHVGAVYIEQDLGSDLHGDRFEITFVGGAEGTQLDTVTIDGDQNDVGLSLADVIFDTAAGGLGADEGIGVEIISRDGIDDVSWHVEDGASQLVLYFVGFDAGEKIVFEVDADEIQELDENMSVAELNDGIDPITSGIEFQGSTLVADFSAEHFFDVTATGKFRNRYDDNFAGNELDLPADNDGGLRDRTAGAVGHAEQVPLPASIRGRVQLSTPNGDCFGDVSNHAPVVGVTIELLNEDGRILATTFTGENGEYSFEDLLPGSYGVREQQPDGLLDGAENPGTIDGRVAGELLSNDVIASIDLLGGQTAEDVSFCEHLPVSIAGSVYHDRQNDGTRDREDAGIPSVVVQILDSTGNVVAETVTDDNGRYSFQDLSAGRYAIKEVQPAGWIDGLDTAGTVDDRTIGTAQNPGDRIDDVILNWGDAGEEYNFGEFRAATLSGRVQLSTRDGDCFGETTDHEPVIGAVVRLLDSKGDVVAETVTDANGQYGFNALPPGEYSLVELTPEDLIDGGARAGSVDGEVRGRVIDGGRIQSISLTSGESAVEFDFCEHQPAQIGGFVYYDEDNDGKRDPSETPIEGVAVVLMDDDDIEVARTRTDKDGHYQFEGLTPGVYSIQEIHPDGYLDGQDSPGRVNGGTIGVADNPGDRIRQIELGWGDVGEDYNFGELRPATLRGMVHTDLGTLDCEFNPETGEIALAGVKIELLDATGVVLAETVTDENGEYEFTDVVPGEYSIRETQPEGYFNGSQTAPVGRGDTSGENIIKGISVRSGEVVEELNFCEEPPAILRGIVHTDLGERDCEFDPEAGEITLAGVTIELLNARGDVIAETQTDRFGAYEFAGLRAGQYSVREIQPAGYFNGGQSAPDGKGDTSGENIIAGISVSAGELVEELNFCEELPATLRGIVHTDVAIRDCEFNADSGDEPLAGVVIELLDRNGDVVARTVTNQFGVYEFSGLRAGEYSVREIQPEGLFDGRQSAPDGKGDTSGVNLISRIKVGIGEVIDELNFCEDPPSILSGYVFKDGDDIQLRTDEALPERISELRDGRRTDDDTFLAGVVVQLRDGITGLPVSRDFVLPGIYGSDAIQVLTDENGYYEFQGLQAGQYSVFQSHPSDYIDGVDTPGTSQGFVFNPGEPTSEAVLLALKVEPLNDAIVRISLRPGQSSLENNFSEIRVQRRDPAVPPAIPPLPPIEPPPPPPVVNFPVGFELPNLPDFIVKDFGQMSTDVAGFTWHLSVIDAGRPRGDGLAVAENVEPVWFTSTYLPAHQKAGRHLVHGQWFFERSESGTPIRDTSFFGVAGAIPVVGDFNGDGVFEVAVFKEGEWFIDVNGNGIWDADDLWAKLGRHKKRDLPVTGDWDGDGKDDIGIYGPAWAGDPRAIALEPGLPDNENRIMGRKKNVPPSLAEATDGQRIMKLTSKGNLRADVIDHVFHFGVEGDFPVVGDWNGDGIQAIGIFRAGRWNLDIDGNGRWTAADEFVEYGAHGDIPVVGDFNGDGIDEIGFFRGGKFHLDTNGNRKLDDTDKVVELGRDGDFPVAGDFDGDGTDEVAVYRAVEKTSEPVERPTESVARKAG